MYNYPTLPPYSEPYSQSSKTPVPPPPKETSDLRLYSYRAVPPVLYVSTTSAPQHHAPSSTTAGPAPFHHLAEHAVPPPPSPDMEPAASLVHLPLLSPPDALYHHQEVNSIYHPLVPNHRPYHSVSYRSPEPVLPSPTPPPALQGSQLPASSFSSAVGPHHVAPTLSAPVTPAPRHDYHAASTLPPFVQPAPKPTVGVPHISLTSSSRESSASALPFSVRLVGPIPVRASGPASLSLLPTSTPAKHLTFVLESENSILRKREPEPLVIANPSLSQSQQLAASPSQPPTQLQPVSPSTPQSQPLLLSTSPPQSQQLHVTSPPQSQLLLLNPSPPQSQPLLLSPSPPQPLLVSSSPPQLLLISPSLPPSDYATKRPSLHFELVEEEKTPSLQDVPSGEAVGWNPVEQYPVVNLEPFSKLENSWGGVRQVEIFM